MDNKINQSQLAELLAQSGGLSKTAAEQFVKSFFDIITERVLQEGLVKVKGFGTFKLSQMENRESVNVNTGERITIEGHQKITFIPDAELKDSVNSPFSAFETVMLSEEQAGELARMDTPVEETVQDDGSCESDERIPSELETAQADAVGEQAETESQKKAVAAAPAGKGSGRAMRFVLKVIVWILAAILLLGVLAYLLWPLFANRIADSVDISKPAAEQVEIEKVETVKTETEIQVQESSEPVAVESVPETEQSVPPVSSRKDTVALASASKTDNSKVFVLLESDLNRDLSEYSTADTLNYRTDGVMAVHVMEQGETLTKLALKYYGTKKLWPYIAKCNKSLNLNSIRPGTEVIVPYLYNH